MFCVYLENKRISPTTTNPHLSFLVSFTDFYLFGDAELFIYAQPKKTFCGSLDPSENIDQFFDEVQNMLQKNKAALRNGETDRIEVPLFLDWNSLRMQELLKTKKELKERKKESSLSSILDRFERRFNSFLLPPQKENEKKKTGKEYEKGSWYEYLSENDIWAEHPKQLWFPLDEDIDEPIWTTVLIETGNETALLAESSKYFYYFSFATS